MDNGQPPNPTPTSSNLPRSSSHNHIHLRDHNSSTAPSRLLDLKTSGTALAAVPSLSNGRLGSTKSAAPKTKSSTRHSPVPQQRAWASTNPEIATRFNSTQRQNCSSSPAPKPALNSFFNRVKEGQRVPLTVNGGAEFEDLYAKSPPESPNDGCHWRMVQQKKPGLPDTMNGPGKRQSTMAYSRSNNGNKPHNGNRSSFQTDTGISGGRQAPTRELTQWTDDGANTNGAFDGGLEESSDGRGWDQFATNERMFGVQTDYDENLYTTTIDRNRADYGAKAARADRIARKIESSNATSAHAAEERIVDHVGTGEDSRSEEDKYSGVKRSDFPPLSSQSAGNKYTPPARRAPTGQATVKGAPVDPAIITSQLRAPPNNKPATPKPDAAKSPAIPTTDKVADAAKVGGKTTEPVSKPATKPSEISENGTTSSKPAEKPATTSLRTTITTGRVAPPAAKENQPVEKAVLAEFKTFAQRQRDGQREKAEDAKKKKLRELKNFAASFKLGTPVPNDLIGIIAKDPSKQKEIQEKARKNAEEVQRAKEEAKKVEPTVKDQAVASSKPATQAKSTDQTATSSGTGTPTNAADSRGASRAGAAPQHANVPGNGANRPPGGRQSYNPAYQQPFRGDRGPGQNMPRHNQQGGHLSQHLRNGEQQRMGQAPLRGAPEARIPPTGPANANMGPGFVPRHAGMPPAHMAPPRLNPSTQEFRPNAMPFYPTGPSAASSPRSALNNVDTTTAPAAGIVIRRKVKSIDVTKCFVFSHVQTYKPPTSNNRFWEENGGLRPPWETLPSWGPSEDESKDKVSYKQLWERPPFTGAMAAPNTAAVVSHMPHQHQLPFHLQQGAQNAGPRQSPHMPPMQMHAGHPPHLPHMPFNNGDDGTRMMPSASAQSYASPRPGQVPMAYPNMMNSPSHMPYSQPVMPGFMAPGAPQMTPQMRSFSQNPQFMPQQQGQMGPPMMMGPGYMAAPSPMMQGTPQMQMAYPGAHPNFVPPGPVPPQAMQAANGFPSPGRPAAPMMAHQGSQQGQHMYGMSPGAMPPYPQPPYVPQQQPGQMGNMRVPGPQQMGTSPQQMHHYGPQHNHSRVNNYGGKNFSGPPQGPNHNGPAATQPRATDSQEDAK